MKDEVAGEILADGLASLAPLRMTTEDEKPFLSCNAEIMCDYSNLVVILSRLSHA